ncbi:MAG: 4Fe-4S binding protein [Thermodesulfobacteriota bacterium]
MNLLTALFGPRKARPRHGVATQAPAGPAARGRLALAARQEEPAATRCIACGACARACPFGCIRVDAAGRRQERPHAARAKVHVDRLVPAAQPAPPPTGSLRHEPALFLLDLTQCCSCGLCVEACPTGAILFSRNLEPCVGGDCDSFDLLAEFRGRATEPPTPRPEAARSLRA